MSNPTRERTSDNNLWVACEVFGKPW
jgi:hypothetical protein